MDALTWYGLEPTDDPLRWRLPLVPGLSSRFGALFGGCALGAAIAALEFVTARPLVWATVHGVVRLWAEDGTLLATASQSAIVREQR